MNRLILFKTSKQNFLLDLATQIEKHPYNRIILDNDLAKLLAMECFENAVLTRDFEQNIIAIFKESAVENLTLRGVNKPAKEIEIIKLKTKKQEWKSFPGWGKLTLTGSKRKVDAYNRQFEVGMGK